MAMQVVQVRDPRGSRSAVPRNHVVEIRLPAGAVAAAPTEGASVTVRVTDPAGVVRVIPGFQGPAGEWRFRYASPVLGEHAFRTEAGGTADSALGGIRGTIDVTPYGGDNPLYRHGPVRVAADRRHFEYDDGTPFFWLGDTWWMALCKRLGWPEDFGRLVADRVEKGFTVIQIVAGLYPDMPPFDERGANEAGFPWEPEYRCLRPEYFEAADRRLEALVEAGFVPCIVGAWGYFIPWMGVERAKQHWQALIARYAAFPVVWCVAGEANLPYYLTEGFPFDDRKQVTAWTEVARFVRGADPFRRLLSIHPTGLGQLTARGAIDDASLLDFDMLQTGHGHREVLPPSVETLRRSYAADPTMPVLNSEVAYEALLGTIPADIQRLTFWTSMLSGAAGHTYGANGIWQVNRADQPHGNSPHGGNYGTIPWTEAMNLPGSGQLARAKAFLAGLPWQRFEPHPEWAAYAPDPAQPEPPNPYEVPYAAGIPGSVRVVYVPCNRAVRIASPGPAARVTRFDPVSGGTESAGTLRADADGTVRLDPPAGPVTDWVVLLEPDA